MHYAIKFKDTGKRGRGVFAEKNFKKGDILEKAPVIKLTPKERKICEKTILNFYIYPWKSLHDASVILGYGSVYNHSDDANAKWVPLYKSRVMKYVALKDIKKGEEITVNYNGPYEPDDLDWLTPQNQR